MSNSKKSIYILFKNDIFIQCKEHLKYMDKRISLHLEKAQIQTRPSPTNGTWCAFLLPMILIIYTCFDEVSLMYKVISGISIGLMCYSILLTIYLSASSEILNKISFSGCLKSALIASVVINVILKQDIVFSVTFSIKCTIIFAWLLKLSIKECHNTFTIGEGIIMAQSVVLFLTMFVFNFFTISNHVDEETKFISVIIYTVLSMVALTVTILYFLSDVQRNMKTLVCIVFLAALFILLILHIILGSKCVFVIHQYIFIGNDRAKIFIFWMILLVTAICVLCLHTKLSVKASTVTRKTFHILASLVFLTGIIFDVNLMTLAAGIGLAVLIFVEALRKSGIEPVSSALQSSFLIYSDEKDCGIFAMTPIYLYLGLAFPLLVVPKGGDRQLELLSGVLSIGVGDTAASWFGSKFGYTKWPGNNRTVEGTMFNIISQIGTVYILQYFGVLNAECALLRTTFAGTVSALVEAKTSQVDNLVLPLVTLLAFQFTWMFY